MPDNMGNTSSALETYPERLLTTEEAASFLGISVSSLNKWRCYGSGPQFVKLGRAVRYEKATLLEYVSRNSMSSTLYD